MEIISEAASKKKRGRPPAVPPEVADILPLQFTRRHQLNWYYMSIGVGVIGDADDLRWLREPRFRFGIVSELGRLAAAVGEETAREFAKAICKNKPKTKHVISDIRRWRLGQEQSKGTEDGLSEVVCNAIDDYLTRHRAMQDETVRSVLLAVARGFEIPEDDGEDDGDRNDDIDIDT